MKFLMYALIAAAWWLLLLSWMWVKWLRVQEDMDIIHSLYDDE